MSSHSSTCPSGAKTCTAGFGNLILLMKAAAKKRASDVSNLWAEINLGFLLSGQRSISAGNGGGADFKSNRRIKIQQKLKQKLNL